jgi:6-phosphogluconolactonase
MSGSVQTLVVDDPAGVCALRLVSEAEAGAQIALTGGSTPRAAYERAAVLGADWRNATLWFTDERCVPANHEHSNFAMAQAALLSRLGQAPPEVHRMRGEEGPENGASRYADELRAVHGDGIPRLDLVLLGMGSDAHVASLFPGRSEVDERERTVVPVEMSGLPPFVSRISLSLPVINAARSIVFLVTGTEKAEAVVRAIARDPSVPAGRVEPDAGSITWILDVAAANLLEDAGALT